MTDKNKETEARTKQRELEEEKKRHPHAPRHELHEDDSLHPHHKQADHARHHHRPHILHHKGKETGEEKKFIDHENKLHRLEITREVWEDDAGQRQLKKTEKVSGTPSRAKKGTQVKASSSSKVMEQLNSIRLRIAFGRAKTRERGEMVFGK